MTEHIYIEILETYFIKKTFARWICGFDIGFRAK